VVSFCKTVHSNWIIHGSKTGGSNHSLNGSLYGIVPGQSVMNDNIRSLLSLPARLGGLGIIQLHIEASAQYNYSLMINSPLITSLIDSSDVSLTDLLLDVYQKKHRVKTERQATVQNEH
jgi:hypothetical protein